MGVVGSSATAKLLAAVRSETSASGLVGSRMSIAVSGGPDSTAMAHALGALRDELRLRLFAAHLDHGLRGEDAAADAAFARKTMAALGIPIAVGRADVAAYRKTNRLSTEDAARHLRYGFLARAAARVGADATAVAHTLDDLAETTLMRVIRGSGLGGLRGMSALSTVIAGDARLTVFRPLLNVSKADTLAYCAENGIEPRFDSSNSSVEYTRNRVRLELMPQLETYNPRIRAALGRLAATAARDLGFIHERVDEAAKRVIDANDGCVRIARRQFAALHPAIQRRLLMRAFEMATGDARDLEFAHVESMARLMLGASGRRLDLPRGAWLQVDYDSALVGVGGRDEPPLPPLDPLGCRLSVPGKAVCGGWRASAALADGSNSASAPPAPPAPDALGLRLAERFDADALGSGLTIRARKEGDVFQPLGMAGEKRLSDFMVDERIPRRWRERVPLLTAADGRIAWVAGWRIADWAKVSAGSRSVARVAFEYGGAVICGG